MGEESGPVIMRSQENSDEDDEEFDCKIDPYEDYNYSEYQYPADIGGTSNAASPGSSSHDEDPEHFAYDCLGIIDVERLLNESVEKICSAIPVTPALAKILLHTHKWNTETIVQRYKRDCMQLLIDTKLKPKKPPPASTSSLLTRSSMFNAAAASATDGRCCPICVTSVTPENWQHLSCAHSFCIGCWRTHIKIQLSIGVSTAMECMESECHLLVPEDFVLKILTVPDLRAKYEQFVFQDLVKSNPELKFCPGPDCTCVIRAKIPRAKKVVCKQCRTCFCFVCGIEYHAPTDCDTMKKWLIKCADDSETANYITANTKDCPGCHICIEKSGGCNHMQCWKCKHHFCWMCQGDWKNHGSEYYECSRYKENPNIANESAHTKARKALEKYLFYFERWENHYKSLKLEEKMLEKIKKRIDEKVNKHEGTWIDWQYLYNAAALLTKCRYTLQYTYPYAYYMEPGCRKELFEYQQAQLEREIENLSWKVERAESTDRGDMENQMHVAELKRLTLLKDFLL